MSSFKLPRWPQCSYILRSNGDVVSSTKLPFRVTSTILIASAYMHKHEYLFYDDDNTTTVFQFFSYSSSIGTGNLALWLENGNSNPMTWVDSPWRAGFGNSCSVAPSPLLCRLVWAWSLFVCTAYTHICPQIKDPVSICREKKLGSTVPAMAARFPRGKHPEFPVHSI